MVSMQSPPASWAEPSEASPPGRGVQVVCRLAAITAVVVLALAAAWAVQTHRGNRSAVLAQAGDQAALMAETIGRNELRISGLDQRLGETDRQRLRAFVAREAAAGRLQQLRVYTRGARLVADEHGRTAATTGGSHPTEEQIRRVLRDGVTAQVVNSGADRSIVSLAALPASDGRSSIGAAQVWTPFPLPKGDSAQEGRLGQAWQLLLPALVPAAVVAHLVFAIRTGRRVRELDEEATGLWYLTLRDRLTGLPNRHLMLERVRRAGREAVEGEPERCAVAVINLNRFHDINEAIGRRNGDDVLVGLARRLEQAVGPEGTVARLGGDEFGVLLPAPRNGSGQMRRSMARVQGAIEEEMVLDQVPLRVEASIGVALLPQHGTDPEELLERAESAMFVARGNQSGIAWYDRTGEERGVDRLSLAGELRRAIDRDELVMHFQPQVSQPSGEVHTLEALVRWQHPERGLLGPDTFIPMAERTRMIDDLTEWVITHCLAQLQQWRSAGREITLAVNVSARTLHNLSFPDLVEEALYQTSAQPDWLLLEITETALVADPARAALVLDRLHDNGLRLSLDDFGQGYTSLSQLSTLPFSELKIDKSFVMNMRTRAEDAAIVRSVIDLAHNLSLTVVAEGVEDEETLGVLIDLGCDTAQGYHFSPPLPADDLQTWLATYTQERVTAAQNAAAPVSTAGTTRRTAVYDPEHVYRSRRSQPQAD